MKPPRLAAATDPSPAAQRIVVAASAPGARLDAWLRERLPLLSRGAIQRLIAEGAIRVNDGTARPDQTPRAGDVITVAPNPPRAAALEPEAIPLDVLFEDRHLLVLNKAPGMVVHPAAGHAGGTLVQALLHHCAGQLSGIGGVARPGIVHRLDKDTSGCLVVAKTDAAHVGLARQFAERESHKVYQAIVCGDLRPDHGEVRAAIARHPNHRQRMAVTEGGRDAWTTWTVRERLRDATWVEAVLHTGRTHQVRVHFRHLGHPVVGDAIYGKRAIARLTEERGYTAPRQMLHAWRLGFRHPEIGEDLEFEAPLPADFRAALQSLRR